MRTFRSRRVKAILACFLVVCASWVFIESFEVMQNNAASLSGWVLLVLVLVLTLLNARKKLTYPPLLKSSTWLQVHIYIGWLGLFVFLIHTSWKLPNGQFETIFYVIFLLLAFSGILGVVLTRVLPKQLASRGSEVIYERIPKFVRQLREQAESLVLESVSRKNSAVLSQFYQQRLGGYFSGPIGLSGKILGKDRPLMDLQNELKALYRYLTDDEKEVAERLGIIIETKSDLDFHYVRQGILKYWLFVHIPLTYSMLVFTLVHLMLVQVFSRGLS